MLGSIDSPRKREDKTVDCFRIENFTINISAVISALLNFYFFFILSFINYFQIVR
jgi:hypothetical protein